MKAIITNDKLEIQDNTLYNSGSIQYYEIDVEFSSDWEGLTKYAVLVGAEKIKLPVVANKLHVDQRTSGTYTIGFVGYTLEDDEKVYQISTNLECIYFQTGAGEIEANEPSDLPDPTTWETYLSEIQAIVDGAENVNITAEKVGDTTHITTTDKTGTTTTTDVTDGKDAKINGVNTLTVEGGANVSIEQEGSTLIISATDTTDYPALSNKPKINNVELDGSKSLSDLGIKQEYTKSDVGLGNVDNIRQYSASNPPPYPVNSVNGQTGTVVIDTHDDLIPTQASSTNKLTTENFVNSTVATSTATFRGTYNSLAELEQVSADENDYGFVVSTDTAGNTVYNRYKYASGTWVFEYALNNSSFTAAQWEAIQSGITDDLVAKLQGIEAGAEVNIVEGLKIGNTTQEIDNKIIEITPDTTPVEDSTNVIDSNAVYELENMLPTDTATGDIDNAQPYKVLNVVADGKYQQDSTSGKNKLNYNLAKLKSINSKGTWNDNVYSYNGLTITVNEDLSIKFNGTITAKTTFFINNEYMYLPTGTYYLSGELNGSRDTHDLRIFNYDGASSVAADLTGAREFSLINNNQNFNVAITIRNGQTLNNVLFYPMLATTNDTTYEPYTGGIPSPNPDYPQPITQVTSMTWNRVGEQLFDKDHANILRSYFNSSTPTISDNSNTYTTVYIPCEENKTYTISKTAGARFSCGYTKETPAIGVSIYGVVTDNTASSIMVNTESGAKYIVAFVRHASYDTLTEQQVLDSLMIAEGTDTTYKPYQGQSIPIDLDGNEVCATDTAKDKVLVDRYGNVALQKNSDKYILPENGDWQMFNNIFYLEVNLDYSRSQSTICICDNYRGANNVDGGGQAYTRGNNTIEFYYPSSLSRIYLRDDRFNNRDGLKTWLSTHNTTLYYALATPQIIPLPKLSVLPTTLKGINHTWVDTNLGITDIEVEYVEDLQAEIDALRAMIGG